MARLSVTTQKITRAGLVPALTAPNADGDIVDAGNVFLMVTNGSGASVDVTVQTPAQVSGLDVSELTVAVAAGATKLIGPFPVGTFARPQGGADAGKVYVNYSSQTSITRGVVSF